MTLTPGQASDAASYDVLMAEDGPNDPAIMLADKGYDSAAICADLDARGTAAMIPSRSNRKKPRPLAKRVYAMRNRIERFFNKLKNSRRVASRYDKLAESFMGFVQLAALRMWVKFVHTT